jgi:hypothetical protein
MISYPMMQCDIGGQKPFFNGFPGVVCKPDKENIEES